MNAVPHNILQYGMGVVQVFLQANAVISAEWKKKKKNSAESIISDGSKIIPWRKDSWYGPNLSGDREWYKSLFWVKEQGSWSSTRTSSHINMTSGDIPSESDTITFLQFINILITTHTRRISSHHIDFLMYFFCYFLRIVKWLGCFLKWGFPMFRRIIVFLLGFFFFCYYQVYL